MIRFIIALILIQICHFHLAAQDNILTIIGESQLTESANQAEFYFTIKKDGKTLKNAFSNAKSYLNSIQNELISIGLDSSSIQQSKLWVDDKYISLFTTNKIEAILRAKILLNNLDLLDDVLDILGKWKVEYISEIKFRLLDNQPLNEKAYVEAIENAKLSADVISKTHNLKLGKILSIVEIQDKYSDNYTAEPSYSKVASMRYDYSMKVFPDIIYVEKKVKVTFELIQ